MNTQTPDLQSAFADRLVTLSTGATGIRSALQVEVKAAPEQAPAVLEFVASDATLDRTGDIVSPAGWRLETYRTNPVFLNMHQWSDIVFTLGKALVTDVRELGGRQALYQQIQFAVDANPMAKIAHGLYAGGFLRAVSVGMVPRAWEDGRAGDNFVRRIIEQELLEVSAVTVPANPSALILGLKAGAVEKCDVRELAAILRAITGEPVNTPEAAQLLTLARDVHRIAKSL